MSDRELVVLGTSSQVPTRERNHNGYVLLFDGEAVLFDPGEGTQRQMTHAGLSVARLSSIFITHFHGDHCLGLPGVVQRRSVERVTRSVDVVFPASGQAYLDRLRHASAFDERAPLREVPVDAEGAVAVDSALVVSARRLVHEPEACGWRLEEPAGLHMLPAALEAAGVSGPMVGELIRRGGIVAGGREVRLSQVSEARRGQSFAFVMDTAPCAGALELAAGVDLLVCEATFSESEAALAEAYHHLTAAQAARIARDAGARRLVITHFSQRYPDTSVLLAEAKAVFPETVAARDLTRIPLPPRHGGPGGAT